MVYVKTERELDKALAYLRRHPIVALDTETTGLNPLEDKILLLQIGNEEKQFVFDVYKLGTHIYKVLDWIIDKEVVCVIHNAKYDYGMIKTNFNYSLPEIRCTMIGEQLLNQGRNISASFNSVALKYIGVALDKTQQTTFIGMKWGQEFTERQLEYAGEDVQHLLPIYKKIQNLLNERGMKELSKLEYETTKVTADMEINGIFLDSEKWTALKDIAIEAAEVARKKLDTYFKDYCEEDLFGNLTINYNSPKQILPILNDITRTQFSSTSE